MSRGRTGDTWISTPLLVASFLVLAAPPPATADVIDELVAQVSVAEITAHIAALEFPRATPEDQEAASDYIVGRLELFGYTVTLDPVSTSANIIARRHGTFTPDRVLVVGAHFDTVPGSPGADDNASGVAGMLEIARLLNQVETGLSVELVGFALEEIGKVGSTHYAARAQASGADITGALVFEMIGYTCSTPGCQAVFNDIPGCLDVEPEGLDVGEHIADVGNDASAGLIGLFAEVAETHVPALPTATAQVAGTGTCFPDIRRSDHAPFWDRGYRALMLTDTANFRNPNYHQPTDTLDTLDLEFARRVTQATLATVLREAGVALFGDGLESGDLGGWGSATP